MDRVPASIVSTSQSVDIGFIPLVESYLKTLENGIHSFLALALSIKEGIVWRTSRQACLLRS